MTLPEKLMLRGISRFARCSGEADISSTLKICVQHNKALMSLQEANCPPVFPYHRSNSPLQKNDTLREENFYEGQPVQETRWAGFSSSCIATYPK